MSLYEDLTEILTPYADKINQNTASLDDLRDDLDNLDLETDKTLGIDGKFADAKTVGDALEAMQTDVSEHTTELALLITKTEKPKPVPTEIVQCADLSGAMLDGTNKYRNVKIELPWIGRYDMNPSNLNLWFWYMKAYDSNGNQIQIYRGDSPSNVMQSSAGGYFEKVDNRTIKTYTASGTLDWTWRFDGDIAYLYNDGMFDGYVGSFEDSSQLVGVTYGGASETYIPYDESKTSDVPPEYEYEYSEELTSAINTLIETDKTLSVDGKPADGKTVGDAINAVASDVGEVQDALEHLDVETDKTLSIDGKPADAKIVGDAVTEHTTELALLITKTEKPQPEPTEIVQCADLSKARLESNKRYWNVKIEIPWIGRYDMNPSNLNLRFWYMHPYDSSGNKLQLYRGESTFGYLQINNGGYFEKVDNRTIKTYNPSGTLDWTWHTDGDISYLGFDDGSVYNAYIGDFEDPAQLVGVTYGGTSETYIPYGDSEAPDVPTEYVYEYTKELISAIHDSLAENHTDDEPVQDSANFVKSGGVISYLLKETYNLIDPSWFDWTEEATAGYIALKTGLYIPVEAGRVLLSNVEKVSYGFYDANKVSVGNSGSAIAYAPITIPSGAVYMRCNLNNGAGYIPSGHKVVIYYSDNTVSPQDDRRDYIDHMNLQGMRGSNEIFDYYAPTSLDKDILQMAKYSAVRNINFCNNVIRIGTFNMYNPRTTRGWKTAKKMFADFAVDIVGFQEVSQGERLLTEFLKGWQFTDGVTWTNRAIASHFKVLSYDTYSISVTNNTFMRAIIQLPRYADVINPTLSVYDYHGIWEGGTPEKRAQEVSEILTVIAQDTSDFIVVVGDTNAQSASEWDTWRNAGFTPVHDGNGVITTIDEWCLDNVFYGSGITCKNYHVVPAEDYLVTISGEDLPISDHDFVFADLQFDFDSLIRS